MDLYSLLGSLLLQDAGAGGHAEEWLRLATQALARSVVAVGAVVAALGALRAFTAWLAQQLPLTRHGVPTKDIRLGLGRSLGLALEFLLAAFILDAAIAPTWEAIGKLAAIGAIRTLINYFLA